MRRSVDSSGGRERVSTDGGRGPRWRGDGKELFFVSLENDLMAVEIEATSKNLKIGVPQVLFQADFETRI